MLRPAVDAALATARAGLAADPPIPAPPRLRRLLSFTRATGPAVATVRKVVDEDAEFRARVRDATEPEAVGRAGWLWLDRPSGWKDEFAVLLEAAEADAAESALDRDVTQLRRALERAEIAARRSDARAADAERNAADAADDLAAERLARRDLSRQLDDVEAARSRAVAERTEAVQSLQRAEHALAEVRAELRMARSATGPPATPAVPPPDPPIDLAAVSRTASRATAAIDDLRAALVDLERLAAADAAGVPGTSGIDPPPASAEGPSAGAPRRRPTRRAPSPLPPGRFDDDPAVAEHLLRLTGALVVIDGYNVTKTAWPDAPLPDQRARLLDLLQGVHARTGAEALVVFDGAEPSGGTGGRQGSGAVRVRFSPVGVEADDVVLELASAVPLHRPVVVVSSDNRVRAGARAVGANVIGSAQFLEAARAAPR